MEVLKNCRFARFHFRHGVPLDRCSEKLLFIDEYVEINVVSSTVMVNKNILKDSIFNISKALRYNL